MSQILFLNHINKSIKNFEIYDKYLNVNGNNIKQYGILSVPFKIKVV